MKIRTGFVSNSSSSSFVIYGAQIDKDEVYKRLKLDPEEDDLYNIMEEHGLESYESEWDDVYIGIPWKQVEDNETGAQFKERVATAIRELLGKKYKCRTFDGAIDHGGMLEIS